MQEIKTFEIIGHGLMNVEQIATYLGVPKSTIYNLSMQGRIPHAHVGKLLRFKKGDIDDWLTDTGCDGKGLES